jgi:hypothetical protein
MAKRASLAVGLTLTVLAVCVVMARSPSVIARTNGVPDEGSFLTVSGHGELCEANEVLPAGTTAIRVTLEAMIGPPVRVLIRHGREVLTRGEQASGWTHPVTVPVKPLLHTVAGVSTCVVIASREEGVRVAGSRRYGGNGRVRIEYLRPGNRSWWALASSVIGRMSFGRATSGIWAIVAVMVAMLALTAIVSVTALRGTRVAWCVALVAALNAACWSVVTPPFQVTDEPAHFAYVKQLAETGTLPQANSNTFSQEEEIAIRDLHTEEILADPTPQTIASSSEQRVLRQDLASAERQPRDGSESAGVATAEPPLYYAFESVPYLIAFHTNLLDRLQLMRLWSGLLAGLTALFAFLFVREALPGEPWAWTTAGLGVALAPLLGFMSGAVNPDSMLFAVCAALFFCLARAFRRGLTRKLAVCTGAVVAIGLLTKLNFIGLLPGVLLGLVLLSWRVARSSRREAFIRLALAGGVAAVGLLCALAVSATRTHGASEKLTSSLSEFISHGSLIPKLEYMWELYLPRLPGMVNDFPIIFPTRQLWFNGFVGLYGWAETAFPNWVYNIALIPAVAIAGLFICALYRSRSAICARAAEIGVYLLMSAGVMAMVAAASYVEFPASDAYYARVRYLFPMLALLGALLALAARGAGRRWGPAVGVLIVVVILAQDIFGQLLVVAHFYG